MQGVSKRFPGVLANQNVDLVLFPGEIHALLGENGAGKSTLMNILAGLYHPDEGTIRWRGKGVELDSPRAAFEVGIGMVHQHFMLVQPLTVAENVTLGLNDGRMILDLEAVAERIQLLGRRYKLRVDPNRPVWQLSVGEQQRVEILKLLYRDVELLILDEPTAVLTPQEAEELGETLRQMTAEGKAVVLITHKLDEVMRFSDRVTVLRDGRVASVVETSQTTKAELAHEMVGREVLFRLEREEVQTGSLILSLRNVHALNKKGLPALQGVSLDIRRGEILGIAGVAGNGQQSLAEVITGLRTVSEGQIWVGATEVTNQPPLTAIEAGVSYIPADRMGTGAVGTLSVADNLMMKSYRRPPLSNGQLLSFDAIRGYARYLMESFRIAAPSPETPVRLLSGGNLQKVILARELDAEHSLLIAAYPSRGLDVGATEMVRRHLLAQRRAGKAILLISEELDELLTLSDRIAVLYEGRIMGIFPAAEANIETLGLMMAGEAIGNQIDSLVKSNQQN
ncbi:MAG: ABC transporter ATP-binding protein [Ardenticatenales bacterium]|nr:ABC transporter ATP-binding protein [Ardenticatenales bacterium]